MPEEDMTDPLFWKKSGDDLVKEGKFSDAVRCYHEAIDLDPQNTSLWNNLGYAYIKLGMLDEAKKCKEQIKAIRTVNGTLVKNVPPSTPAHLSEKSNAPEQPPIPTASAYSGSAVPYKTNFLLIILFIAGIVFLFAGVIGFVITFLIVLFSAYLVYKDAQTIGAGLAPESSSPITLGLLVLFFWIVALPIYIIKRRSIFDKAQPFYQTGAQRTTTQTRDLKTTALLIGGLILLLVIAAIIAAFVFGLGGGTSYSPISPVQSPEQIKSAAINIPYTDLFRYNEQYVGKIVYYQGKIIQSQNSFGNSYIFRIATKKSEYLNDYYEDILWVDYTGDQRFLENDIVNVWGKVKGLKKYQAVLGNEITIPEIESLYMEYVGRIQ